MAEFCYACGPSLTQQRWLCPTCRRLYTFTPAGRMVVRKAGSVGVFELRQPQTFAQFVLGSAVERTGSR